MTLFKHKETGILYVACVLVKDIHFANNNERSGIYFEPYNTKGNKTITHLKSGDYPYNPDKFMADNFIQVATL